MEYSDLQLNVWFRSNFISLNFKTRIVFCSYLRALSWLFLVNGDTISTEIFSFSFCCFHVPPLKVFSLFFFVFFLLVLSSELLLVFCFFRIEALLPWFSATNNLRIPQEKLGEKMGGKKGGGKKTKPYKLGLFHPLMMECPHPPAPGKIQYPKLPLSPHTLGRWDPKLPRN